MGYRWARYVPTEGDQPNGERDLWLQILEWELNVDHLELESLTVETQAEFGSGIVPTVLPVTSFVAPLLPKATLTAPSTSSRIPQSYES